MANFGPQGMDFFNRANQLLYTGTAQRDVEVYPDTIAGQAAFEADVMKGLFTITITDSAGNPTGATISPGTIPPLIKPQPPAAVAFSQKIEGEAMSGNTSSFTFEGTTMVGPFTSSSDYRTASISIVGTNACVCTYRYQTNTSTSGHGSYSVNGGALVEFALEGADGGQRIASFTFTPVDGTNTIRFEGKDGTSFFLDYIIISRTA